MKPNNHRRKRCRITRYTLNLKAQTSFNELNISAFIYIYIDENSYSLEYVPSVNIQMYNALCRYDLMRRVHVRIVLHGIAHVYRIISA